MQKKIVVFGGGTGLSSVLKELKNFPIDITAVVSVSDNGCSTGKLRKEFNIPAVGDIRKVMSSLSNKGDIKKQILEYRFKSTSCLNGHALGNLILTSMLDIKGSLTAAIKELSDILNIKHKILPISEDPNLELVGELDDGSIVEGEEQITKSNKKIRKIYYKEEPKVVKEVLDEIDKADLIIISMGSLYTSILPNIICKDVSRVLSKTTTPIMYLCNALTQKGETDEYTVGDHVSLLNSYINRDIDVVIASNTKIEEEIIKRCETEEQKDLVLINYKQLVELNIELIEADLTIEEDNKLKYDALKLSSLIFSYLMR